MSTILKDKNTLSILEYYEFKNETNIETMCRIIKEYDILMDDHLSDIDLEHINQGMDDIKNGRCTTLNDLEKELCF